MNGNDYVEIAEAHDMQIIKDYVNDIIDGKEDVPDEFKNKWIDDFIANRGSFVEDLRSEE